MTAKFQFVELILRAHFYTDETRMCAHLRPKSRRNAAVGLRNASLRLGVRGRTPRTHECPGHFASLRSEQGGCTPCAAMRLSLQTVSDSGGHFIQIYQEVFPLSKQKSLSQLEADRAACEQKLAQLQHKVQQYENRIAYCEKGERQKRTHRLITRGSAVESVAPTVKTLTEVEFYAFTESVFALPEVQTLLAEAIHDQGRA